MHKFMSFIKLSMLSSSFFKYLYHYGDRMRQLFTSILSQVFFYVLLLIFLFYSGIAGAAIGALIGFKLNKMYFLQTLKHAALGMVVSHKIIRVTFDHFWHSDHANWRGYFLRLIDIISNDLKSKPLRDQDNIFLTTKVSSCEKLINLLTIKISKHNIFDTSGNKTCCSVCLQDFEIGNLAGIFPKCGHKFHPGCISQWLLTNNSCPLCRNHITSTHKH
ncbi:NEP1-interacting protein-like 1 [Bidens hawaiensis]|uniref:NEP1-interacting protein-like 1 n=1 Tax=Bidens hawaiensis TaxID=980011 RepID=UPI00404A9BC7